MADTSSSSVRIIDNPDEERFEAYVDGELAGFAEYQLAQRLVVFTHTEVEDRFEGQGIGSALARVGLDEVRSRGLKALPLCPFIKSWIDKHPDYRELAYDARPSKVTD
ncbi:MAG TPA: GNAT family N-acetyltransferase [Nocardioidaceae bacterium]|jgi:predicted GNAT family acetyltransferase|nr:GNAT family N-acetyltransferase [Nocardioidaceae bacterium]